LIVHFVGLFLFITENARSKKQNNNILFYYSTYWQHVSVTRPPSGHHYLKFKTGYMQHTLISCHMGSHKIFTLMLKICATLSYFACDIIWVLWKYEINNMIYNLLAPPSSTRLTSKKNRNKNMSSVPSSIYHNLWLETVCILF
jgi:hypothetical protein